MKKLFLALALTGFVGAAAINTVSAMTHAKICVNGGEEDKKKKGSKKCAKGAECCKSKTGATADAKCTKGEAKKCCSKTTDKASGCGNKTTSGNTETKEDVKKVEEAK